MNHDYPAMLAPKLLVTIIDRESVKQLEEILREKHLLFHYMFNAKGTASSEILKTFGLSGTDKTVCICIAPEIKAQALMTSVADRLSLVSPGNGITFVMPISGVSAAVSHAFSEEMERHKERFVEWMDREAEKTVEEARYELVVAVINQGFSEELMESARAVGARGGTIVHARRAGIEDAVKFFGITLQAEKEIVAILVHHHQKKELMQRIVKTCGINTDAHGIVIALPVESCAGIAEEHEA